ncbi:MAG: hypothetical protein D3914_13595 [Candidatus Electrothrix sp. LOE2]|nr:hypothetical protein [Candidatus Electrothrix sp. LOE2]
MIIIPCKKSFNFFVKIPLVALEAENVISSPVNYLPVFQILCCPGGVLSSFSDSPVQEKEQHNEKRLTALSSHA